MQLFHFALYLYDPSSRLQRASQHLSHSIRFLASIVHEDLLTFACGFSCYVPCQDQHRVVIKWPGAPTDYIHANYVGTPVSEKRFICTQGPLDNTVTEFWMMVLQEESETIIMLCNCVETMRAMSPDEPSISVSILVIKFSKPDGTNESREVRHYQWLDWPDRGVPPCRLTSMLQELLSRIRGTKKPIIVHCSAGIGRTGTIVAIEYILGALPFDFRLSLHYKYILIRILGRPSSLVVLAITNKYTQNEKTKVTKRLNLKSFQNGCKPVLNAQQCVIY
ncbi:unnamed protein product [Angiostrongylus costaricensis]|uniref:Protein-tyrosine phosphatase n=1 Tax=Angiostrongylus costaricensis TaxID=334426 RepID=A0A158PKH9_ANGCS|nr:unnamed protein product [Angiostrongylus costaricensis]